jgi:hypothetical protein
VISWFQAIAFNFNLYRYDSDLDEEGRKVRRLLGRQENGTLSAALGSDVNLAAQGGNVSVGFCTLLRLLLAVRLVVQLVSRLGAIAPVCPSLVAVKTPLN